tara:strand:+ start:14514 stop:15833 length:1320 start_codon:yes stop_codon:yes gene_type:complete
MKSLNLQTGSKLWGKAQDIIPGGNMLLSKNKNLFSPSLWPCYYQEVSGSEVWDLDGNRYLDFSSNGVGACSLGHKCKAVDDAAVEAIHKGVMSTLNSPSEVWLAEELLNINQWAGMVRFARTGGEANALAIRIARAFCKKDKVAICGYHGWHDWYLAANISDSSQLDEHLLSGLNPSGVPKALKGSICPLKYNSFEDLDKLLDPDIGILKMEVVRSEQPLPGYLEKIRDICDEKSIILIFDECTSGFREAYGGIHKKYNIYPDLCMYGKALGNGYAITAVVGKEEIMRAAETSFISSTFWTEAIGPSAALATLKEMERLQSWVHLPIKGKQVKEIWKNIGKESGIKITINGIDALPTFTFDEEDPAGCKTFFTQDMLAQGFLATTLFYPTMAHSNEEIQLYESAVQQTFNKLRTILSGGEDIGAHIVGPRCQPTFERLA